MRVMCIKNAKVMKNITEYKFYKVIKVDEDFFIKNKKQRLIIINDIDKEQTLTENNWLDNFIISNTICIPNFYYRLKIFI